MLPALRAVVLNSPVEEAFPPFTAMSVSPLELASPTMEQNVLASMLKLQSSSDFGWVYDFA